MQKRKCVRNSGNALKAARTAFYFLATLFLLVMAMPHPAQAYVDPGSGSMIWQILAASIVGSLFYLRKAVNWVRSRIGSSTRIDSVR